MEIKPPSVLIPLELCQMDSVTLGIIWSDTHHALYKVKNLRFHCPCAGCVDEWTHERRIKESDLNADIKPVRIESMGRYALKFDWSDGHNTGIYPFEYLRRLCQCPQCAKQSQ